MKEYASIPVVAHNDEVLGKSCIAFKKEDGSNLRFLFNSKTGWSKFGTRHRLFDKSDLEYGEAIPLFLNKYASDIENTIKKEKEFRSIRELICYCEFFGPHSFAGRHDPKLLGVPENKPYDLVLFDVNLHKKGLLEPRNFLNIFGNLDIAKVIFEGILDESFIQDVKDNKYPVVEGVVCKGCEGKAPHGIWMRKIKTDAYRAKLKSIFSIDWEKYC